MPPRRLALPLACSFLLCAPLACAHGSAPATSAQAAKPKAVVPPGCEALISGDYRHEDDASYRYKAQDDGHLLIMHPYRTTDDAQGEAKAQDMVLELRREPEGFVGVFRMTETAPTEDGGVRCQALFSAKVLACSPTKLTLQVEQEYAMDQACKRVDTGGPDLAEHVLLKITSTGDGG